MKADLILLDLQEITEDPWISPDLNIAEVFIHRAKGTHVNTVIIAGEVVMEDRRFQTIDLDLLYEEVKEQASKGLSPEQRDYAENLSKIKPYYQRWYRDWVNLDFEPYYIMNSKK